MHQNEGNCYKNLSEDKNQRKVEHKKNYYMMRKNNHGVTQWDFSLFLMVLWQSKKINWL